MSDPETESTRKTNRWWLGKPFLIMVTAGCFHLGRGAPVDGIIFLATAAALAVAEIRDPARPDLRLPIGVAIAAVPLAWVMSTWQPATVAVAVTGAPMLYLALTTRTEERAGVRSGWWLGALLGVLICLWELAQFLQQPDARTDSWDHPTLSVVLAPLFVPGPGRTVLAIVWLAAGVLLARLILGSRRCTR